MVKISVRFLQAAVVLAGCAALGLMLWVPPHEGRNANASLFAVYFKDPFLAFGYIGSLPFFYALFRAFRVLGSVGRGEAFTPRNVEALRAIRNCALATAGVIAAAAAFVRATAGANDDPAGFVVPGAVAVFGSLAAAAAVVVLEDVFTRAAGGKPGGAAPAGK